MHFSAPFRGAFQLSLTVLLHYRSWIIFSLRCYFHLYSLPTAKDSYSGNELIPYYFAYGGITLFASTFQNISTVF